MFRTTFSDNLSDRGLQFRERVEGLPLISAYFFYQAGNFFA